MLLQLRVLENEEFVEGEIFRFQGNIIRVSWEPDGRLVAGRARRPLLVFYQHESGCRVRCVPAESLKLNDIPLDRRQRLAVGDRIERPDGQMLIINALQLQDDQELFVIANGETLAGLPVKTGLIKGAIALLTGIAVLGGTLGVCLTLPETQPGLAGRVTRIEPPATIGERTVRDVALELKEVLLQVSESRESLEELLVTLASTRRIAQKLAQLHAEDPLAVTVYTAVNSFYQLSAALVAEDPEAFQAASESANRCLSAKLINRGDEVVLFYRSLASISLRESTAHLRKASGRGIGSGGRSL
ncbi:MAG: hypothetical protein H7Y22_18705 [Gemmatimonadaceae bacterium]|nr:hypothetical protein [Gloeobacterales cyanobacterium ES-bin-141]